MFFKPLIVTYALWDVVGPGVTGRGVGVIVGFLVGVGVTVVFLVGVGVTVRGVGVGVIGGGVPHFQMAVTVISEVTMVSAGVSQRKKNGSWVSTVFVTFGSSPMGLPCSTRREVSEDTP